MATAWLKSLQCKTRAFDDVVHHHHRRRSLSQSSSCKSSDIVETTSQPKPKTPPFKRPISRKPNPDPQTNRTRSARSESLFPSLTELPGGHPSRNVVEMIFLTSWGDKSFSGDIEMVFKVQNLTRTVTRFEEHRESVKSRVSSTDAVEGGEDHARCVADGNEVLRFYCLGAAAGGGAYEVGCGAWDAYGGKGASVCTYSGSGSAHEHAGGGGRGRRAMLVCRVLAGRVAKQQLGLLDNRLGYDSVSGEDGELLVFDSRAVLPCFLIIYKL